MTKKITVEAKYDAFNMTKTILLLSIALLLSVATNAQKIIEWSADYQLQKSDFQAEAPNSGQMQTASGSFSVEYETGGLNLVFNRNLNENVSCFFQKNASYIDDGTAESTARLLRYQQLIFNLYEIQARNLRKKFFEERKTMLTKGPSELHQEAYTEHAKLLSRVERDTFNGTLDSEIDKWMKWSLEELENLGDFCKTCNPKKKKRK
ncbi:hypothetical protein [Draconibacterium halophilum]|uniref:Uncharacterized protein n=1 Tax=Draconibacterium halophilum TaxID=2706887 RepID=A0A6C0RCY6_9BACT|nr:hypothetical protein [Draconibacterium halophilum]QIA07989.1 hypothetical protein G0Q07_09730 [Draconibacterium halophilum]